MMRALDGGTVERRPRHLITIGQLAAYAGVTVKAVRHYHARGLLPEPLPYDEARAREIVGSYENDVMTFTVGAAGQCLRLEIGIRPEIRAAAESELPPDPPPADFGLLPGDRDEYVITGGALKGQRGFFTRDESGAVVGVDLAGRVARRRGSR